MIHFPAIPFTAEAQAFFTGTINAAYAAKDAFLESMDTLYNRPADVAAMIATLAIVLFFRACWPAFFLESFIVGLAFPDVVMEGFERIHLVWQSYQPLSAMATFYILYSPGPHVFTLLGAVLLGAYYGAEISRRERPPEEIDIRLEEIEVR